MNNYKELYEKALIVIMEYTRMYEEGAHTKSEWEDILESYSLDDLKLALSEGN